jgi:hypothetical protein
MIFLFGISILLASCRTPRFVYSPSTPNNPYFKEIGESKLAAYYSATGTAEESPNEYNNGFELQAAYAPGNHWAITADYFSRKEKDIFSFNQNNYYDSSVVRYDRHITSFGAGYFTPIQKNSNVFLNAFAGVGFGKFNFTDKGTDNGVNYSRYHNADITNWYIQPAVNIYFKDYIRTAFIGQIAWVHYGKISTSYFESELNYFDLHLIAGKTLSFFAGTWNIQATHPKMNWLYLDGSFTISSEPLGKDLNIEARNTVASIGLSIDFSKIKK